MRERLLNTTEAEWWTTAEVAARLRISKYQVIEGINSGAIRALRIGGKLVKPRRIHREEVQRLANQAKPKRKAQAGESEPDSLGLYQDEKETAGARGQ